MRLLAYIGKRILQLIPILLGVTIITFTTARLLPGDAAILAAGPMGGEEQINQLRDEMGLNEPIWKQYGMYLNDLLHGDLGTSWRTGKSVTEELAARFPATFELVTMSMLVAIMLGIPLGVVAAVNQGTKFDHLIRLFSVAGVSIPVFWSGLILIFLFYSILGWAPPPSGRIGFLVSPPNAITGFYVFDAIVTLNGRALLSSLRHMSLPMMTMVFAMLSPIVRITRSSMLDVISEDYIQAAWASGLKRRTILYRDALRNALLPVITMIGTQYGYSLGGEVLVEQIFSWPGMARYSVQAIFNLDYAPVQGFVMVMAVIYVTIYLIIDVLYAVLDPRVRY